MPVGYTDLNHGFPARRAVRRLYRQLGTWRSVADALGDFSPAYWNRVAAGRLTISEEAENLLRRVWHWPPKGQRRLDAMDPADLAWAIRNRQEVKHAHEVPVGPPSSG